MKPFFDQIKQRNSIGWDYSSSKFRIRMRPLANHQYAYNRSNLAKSVIVPDHKGIKGETGLNFASAIRHSEHKKCDVT